MDTRQESTDSIWTDEIKHLSQLSPPLLLVNHLLPSKCVCPVVRLMQLCLHFSCNSPQLWGWFVPCLRVFSIATHEVEAITNFSWVPAIGYTILSTYKCFRWSAAIGNALRKATNCQIHRMNREPWQYLTKPPPLSEQSIKTNTIWNKHITLNQILTDNIKLLKNFLQNKRNKLLFLTFINPTWD